MPQPVAPLAPVRSSRPALGRLGLRSRRLARLGADSAVVDATRLEASGFTALWMSQAALVGNGANLLKGTGRMVVATSVANIWQFPASELANAHRRLADPYAGRVVTGIGAGHRPLVDRHVGPGTYGRPVESMRRYLDELDRPPMRLPAGERIIAAIWPRMQAVARDRALGTHPYLVTPEHVRETRHRMGPDTVVAPAVPVVVEPDAALARRTSREHLANPYLDLPNYADNLHRLGFSDGDLRDGGSDRLVDAIVAWGSAERVAERIREFFDAGADHVALHALGGAPDQLPVDAALAVARALAIDQTLG